MYFIIYLINKDETSLLPLKKKKKKFSISNRYSKLPNLTKIIDVILIRHNDNIGSSSISTKGEFRLSSSVNDESGEILVDTTLSILKMLLLGFIIFLFVRKGKFLYSTT